MLLFLVLAVSLPGLEFYVVTRSYSRRTFLCTLALLPWLVWNNVYLPATHMSAEWLVESRSLFAYLNIWHVDFLLFLLLLPYQLQLKAYEITSNIHRLKLCLCHRSQQLHRAWLVNRTFLRLALFLDTASFPSLAVWKSGRGPGIISHVSKVRIEKMVERVLPAFPYCKKRKVLSIGVLSCCSRQKSTCEKCVLLLFFHSVYLQTFME